MLGDLDWPLQADLENRAFQSKRRTEPEGDLKPSRSKSLTTKQTLREWQRKRSKAEQKIPRRSNKKMNQMNGKYRALRLPRKAPTRLPNGFKNLLTLEKMAGTSGFSARAVQVQGHRSQPGQDYIQLTALPDENAKLTDCYYEKKDWRACTDEVSSLPRLAGRGIANT
jgi:hypothetical protein